MTSRRVSTALFISTAALFLVFSEGAISGSDGATMYRVTQSIVNHGNVRSDLGLIGRGGHTYSRYGLAIPFLGVPVYAATAPLSHARWGEKARQAAVSSIMPLIASALIVAIFLLALDLGASTAGAVVAALAAVVGTFALAYVKEYASEPLTALGITLAIRETIARRTGRGVAWLMIATAARAQTLTIVPFFAFVMVRRDGWRATMRRAAVPGLVGLGLLVGYNVIRFGSPLKFGYQDVAVKWPQANAALGLFTDPSKSVLLFAPIVILLPTALRRLSACRQDAAILLVANFAAVFLVTTTLAFWGGDWAWGPRYLLLAVVPACAALGPIFDAGRVWRVAILACAFTGFLVSAPTLLVSTRAQQLDSDNRGSPTIPRQWALLPPTGIYTARHLTLYQPGTSTYYRSFTLWEVNLPHEVGRRGIPVAAGGVCALVAVATFSGWRLVAESLPTPPWQ